MHEHSTTRLVRLGAAFLLTGITVLPQSGVAQESGGPLAAERREFVEWLRTAPTSPRKALVVLPVERGGALTFGPATADIPLVGVGEARLEERRGRLTLRQNGESRPLARGRPVPLGRYHVLAGGPAGRTTVTVFAPEVRAGKDPVYFPYDSGAARVVALTPPARPASQRLLAPDGIEVEATEAGAVSIILGGVPSTLRVMRLPGATQDESELEIYFRDGSNGRGTYPAGRFVSLIPRPDGRYLLDFNRARNPFCAYNTAYPCPAPWRGNALPAPMRAGERYEGGGLDVPPAG